MARPSHLPTDDGFPTVAMPRFVEPQLCSGGDGPPSGTGWLHEIKFDGYRTQVRVEGGKVRLTTRGGQDWTEKYGAIASVASALPDAMLDGEVVALDAEGLPDYPALQAAIAAGDTDRLVFYAFDLLFLEGLDVRRLPLVERKAALSTVLGRVGNPAIRYVDHFATDGREVFASAGDLGLEGIISKRADSRYRSGRTDGWRKSKFRPSMEVVLGGWTETDGRFRSLIGGVYRDGQLTYSGRVGTGFTERTAAALVPLLLAHEVPKSPFRKGTNVPGSLRKRWLDPVLVAEIEFAGWSTEGSARQAAFKGLRDDRVPTEVTDPRHEASGGVDADVDAEVEEEATWKP